MTVDVQVVIRSDEYEDASVQVGTEIDVKELDTITIAGVKGKVFK